MKTLLLPLLASLLVLCGCAHEYVIKLSNGNQVTAASKPKLQGSAYHYKDALGRDVSIPSGKVTEIEPATSAKEETKTFQPPAVKKERHWYFLWLA
jgi:hypothetical protein